MASTINSLIEGGMASEIGMGSVIVSPTKGGVAFEGSVASVIVMLRKRGVALTEVWPLCLSLLLQKEGWLCTCQAHKRRRGLKNN